MLLQFGMNSVANNIVKLIGTCTDHRNISTMEELRAGFVNFLNKNQPRKLARNTREIEYILTLEDAGDLREDFTQDSLLNDRGQTEVILLEKDEHAEEKKKIIQDGINCLKSLHTGHFELINTIISDIFILPSSKARAGSTSQAIGVIWANPKLTYSCNDTAEIMTHELTHNTMFLDELCDQHYDYNLIIGKENWPISAILNTNRPFDKVLHSAVVAMEILLLREGYIGHPVKPLVHPPTDILKSQLQRTIQSMEETAAKNKGILTDRAVEIIEKLKLNLKLIKK